MLFRNQHPSTDCQYLPFQPPLRFYRIFQIHQEYLQRIPQQDFLSVVDNFSHAKDYYCFSHNYFSDFLISVELNVEFSFISVKFFHEKNLSKFCLGSTFGGS